MSSRHHRELVQRRFGNCETGTQLIATLMNTTNEAPDTRSVDAAVEVGR